MTAKIRHAELSDMQAVLDIFNHEVLTSTVVYQTAPQTLQARESWYNDRVTEGFPVIVAVVDDVVVGFGSYGHFRVGYKYTVEHSVYIHKGYRGLGISKQILDWLVQHARAHDFHVMMAVIDSENELSISLHKKYGFEEVGSMKQLGYKFGRWLTVKFLQLTFETPLNPV